MRIHRCAPLAVGILLATMVPLLAADQDEAKIIIDRATKAHGGEQLAKLKAMTLRMKGTIHQGTDISFTGEVVVQGADQSRLALDADSNGTKFTFVKVLNGDKAWSKVNDNTTEELNPDQLAELKEGAYHNWVAMLAPLKDKAFTISSLGEVKVEQRPALGVRVSSKGHRDINLYFDKETNLLVKTEMRVKDDQSGMEVSETTVYSDFKDINGIKEAMKLVVRRDDKPFVEATVEEVKREEKLDDSIFSKP